MGKRMDWGNIIGGAFLLILIAAFVGFIAWLISRSSSEAYSIKMTSNAAFLNSMRGQGPHGVTVDKRAQMTIKPLDQPMQYVAQDAPKTSQSVRYIIEPDKPDSAERQDLLKIVNLSIQRLGTTAKIIYSANKCDKAGLIDPMRWQTVIDWGKEMFGIVAIPRGETNVGGFKDLAALEEAINAYDIIPTAPIEQPRKS